MSDLNNLVEQAGQEFDELVNHMLNETTGEDVNHYAIREAVGADLHLLLDCVVSIKIVYITIRAKRLQPEQEIGAESFMPSLDKTE